MVMYTTLLEKLKTESKKQSEEEIKRKRDEKIAALKRELKELES